MRIAKVTDEAIVFDNGYTISYGHLQDCCEYNYADFSVLNTNTVHVDYDFPDRLNFNFIQDEGFIFGCYGHRIFIPCYSEQNGYYSTNIDIYYNGMIVLCGTCKTRYR